MFSKQSASTSTKNKNIWTKNLIRFQDSIKKRGSISLEENSLKNNSKIPNTFQVVGRYLFLGATIKGRKERLKVIETEIISLWRTNFNFPHVTIPAVKAKLHKMMKTYDKCVKLGKYDALNGLFDITKREGEWLCLEDRNLYHLQIESNGRVGYSTGKAASATSIHPSKRRKMSLEPFSTKSVLTVTCSDSESKSDNTGSESEEQVIASTRKTYNKTGTATDLVTLINMSTRQAEGTCKLLAAKGINIETPCQSAIYKSSIRVALKVKDEMKKTLHLEKWSLHIDGKRIKNHEWQVLVLKNELNEVRIATLQLVNGKAATVVNGIKNILDEYNLWNSIKMIITDNTNVNTGRRNGIVTQLQSLFVQNKLEAPQFIGCQHHILDRVLRIVMDTELGGNNISPNIHYPCMDKILSDYDNLKMQFPNGEEEIRDKEGWRDDMKFLYHLTRVFRFYEEYARFPKVIYKSLPNLSNARWNSRAILALLVFNLLPEERHNLLPICRFISYNWADLWFSDQLYNANDYQTLCSSLQGYEKAMKTVKNFWNTEPSKIQIPRTNQCAERAIKCLQEANGKCKKTEKVDLTFLLSNFS